MNKLINGNCLVELPKISNNIFDLVVADPPMLFKNLLKKIQDLIGMLMII